jgi:hypothetical protein
MNTNKSKNVSFTKRTTVKNKGILGTVEKSKAVGIKTPS